MYTSFDVPEFTHIRNGELKLEFHVIEKNQFYSISKDLNRTSIDFESVRTDLFQLDVVKSTVTQLFKTFPTQTIVCVTDDGYIFYCLMKPLYDNVIMVLTPMEYAWLVSKSSTNKVAESHFQIDLLQDSSTDVTDFSDPETCVTLYGIEDIVHTQLLDSGLKKPVEDLNKKLLKLNNIFTRSKLKKKSRNSLITINVFLTAFLIFAVGASFYHFNLSLYHCLLLSILIQFKDHCRKRNARTFRAALATVTMVVYLLALTSIYNNEKSLLFDNNGVYFKHASKNLLNSLRCLTLTSISMNIFLLSLYLTKRSFIETVS